MKNKKATYLLFIANSISGFAQGISMIAIPWYFSNTIKQPALYGKIYWIITIVSIFWGFYVGSIVDQYNRKKIFLATSLVGFGVLFSAALSGYYFHEVPMMMVAGVFATTIFIFNIHYPTLYAFAQEISEAKDYGKITSYIEVQGQTASAFAGACAAVLMKGTDNGMLNIFGFIINTGIHIKPWRLQDVFLLNALSYLIAIVLIGLMVFEPIAKRYTEQEPIWQRLQIGFKYLWNHGFLFLLGVFAASVFVAIMVVSYYLNPIYIKQHLHQSADIYANYEFYFALGSLLAGLFVQRIFHTQHAVKGIIIMAFVSACCYFICVVNSQIWLFFLIALLIGFCNAGSRVLRVNFLFHRIPNQVIGRTSSVFTVINTLFRASFTFVFSFPFFMMNNQIVYAYLSFGIFLFISGIIMLMYYKKIMKQ